MLPKVLLILACLCVVKAAVFTINVYEDEYHEIENPSEDDVRTNFLDAINPENGNPSNIDFLDKSVRSCVNSQCNSICRRLGFARGVCVSANVCRCSGRLAQDASLDNINSEKNQDPEETLVRTVRSCEAAECNAFCRKLGYARGVCIGTYCQCRSRSGSEVLTPEVNESNDRNLRANCDLRWCEQTCRRMGFPGGVCVNDRCKCDILQANALPSSLLPEAETGKGKHSEGYDFLDRSVRSCVNSQCNSICRSLGFASGVCVSANVCRCSGRLVQAIEEADSLDDDNNGISETMTPRDCNLRWCEQNCRRMGFTGGACVNGRCKCDINRIERPSPSLSDLESEKEYLLHFDDDSLDGSPRSCVNSQCNTLCRLLGFKQGICTSSSVCKCIAYLVHSPIADKSIADVGIQDHNDITKTMTPRDCNLRWCEQNCRRMGFTGGVCVNGRCKCDINRNERPSPSLFDVESDNNENTERMTPRDCNLRWCEQNCRRMGFTGGACVNGRCKCDVNRNERRSPSLFDVESDNNEISETRAPRDCNLRWCEQNCRRMGFTSGACVNGRCKCDINRIERPSPSLSDLESDRNAEVANEAGLDNKESLVEEESNDIPQN